MASTIQIGSVAGVLDFSPGAGTYEVAMNPVTGGHYTPAAAPALPLMSGGPPFTYVSTIVDVSYGVVTEQIPIQIKGASHNAIVASLRTLRRALTSGRRGNNLPIWVVQPNTATNPSSFTIYTGDVQESADFINIEAGRLTLRAVMTLRRAAFAYGPALTILNGQSFTNNGSGGLNDVSMGTGLSGDLIYAEQPIGLLSIASAFSGSGQKRFYLATLQAALTYASRADSISTTSTTGVTVGSTTDVTHTGVQGVTYRVVGRITSPTSNLQVRITVSFGDSTAGTGATIYQSPWITPANTSAAYVDFGFWRPPPFFAQNVQLKMRIQPEARSTTGGSATGTLGYLEFLPTLTWARVTSTVSLGSTARLEIDGNRTITNGLSEGDARVLPSPIVAWTISSVYSDTADVRGELPIVVESGLLYLAWTDADVHTNTATASVTLTYVPHHFTLRGAG